MHYSILICPVFKTVLCFNSEQSRTQTQIDFGRDNELSHPPRRTRAFLPLEELCLSGTSPRPHRPRSSFSLFGSRCQRGAPGSPGPGWHPHLRLQTPLPDPAQPSVCLVRAWNSLQTCPAVHPSSLQLRPRGARGAMPSSARINIIEERAWEKESRRLCKIINNHGKKLGHHRCRWLLMFPSHPALPVLL